MKAKFLVGVELCLLTSTAWAQCATGMVNVPGCPPPDHPALGGGNQNVAPPPIQWGDRWGAIASDDAKGVVGAITDMTSKTQAQKAATQECQNRGGSECEVVLTYSNQCAAIIAGANKYNTSRAETVEAAADIGMKVCQARNDKNCRIYYSGCSLPQRIQ